jgi:hypothetical protein
MICLEIEFFSVCSLTGLIQSSQHAESRKLNKRPARGICQSKWYVMVMEPIWCSNRQVLEVVVILDRKH